MCPRAYARSAWLNAAAFCAGFLLERVKGIEPSYSAWKSGASFNDFIGYSDKTTLCGLTETTTGIRVVGIWTTAPDVNHKSVLLLLHRSIFAECCLSARAKAQGDPDRQRGQWAGVVSGLRAPARYRQRWHFF
jgi:hypothetical protein